MLKMAVVVALAFAAVAHAADGVAYVSTAPVSADNIGVNKATALPSSFVISGTHNASISGTYAQIAYVCAGLPVYQKGGSDGLVLYQQDGYKYWHVGAAAQATNASGPPGTTNCGYMDPIYLTSEGFCGASPAGAGCATQWSEYPAGNGIPNPADCTVDPDDCINPAVKIVAAQKGAESWQHPEFARQKHTISTLLVTEADGGEGFDMTMTLVKISQRSSSKFVVVAGVVNLSSSNARALQGVGAALRLVTDPPSTTVFAGVDWVLLMPADNGAYDRAPGLIKAANDARVSNALMISIMDVSSHAPTPRAQWPYFKVEQYLAATWGTPASGKPLEGGPAAAFAVLRTYFFQEHLLLWSQDVRATAHLRMPLETACFAPLHQDDGAAVVASMANFSVNMALPFRGQIFNLTGPQVFGGPELAQIAAAAIPLPGLVFTEIDRRSADRILNATANPGVDGLLDLLGSQTTNCIGLPSPDFHSIVGREPSSIRNFFANNADAFRPAA